MPTQLDPAAASEERGKDERRNISTIASRTRDFVHKLSREQAAIRIQKHYRGYRARRQLKGLGLDARTRWYEVIKDLRYQKLLDSIPQGSRSPDPHTHARENWKLVAEAARHAASDDTSDTDGDWSMTLAEREEHRRKKREAKKQLDMAGKMMDLQYWLEMVDRKHRYGSNLRAYHNEWKKSNTHENFFYWLDLGEGRNIELPTVSRERLEKEQVRYLSREERLSYLVRVDEEGKLCWAKNGQRITTSTDYKDSVEGVVPVDSRAPTWSSHDTNKRSQTASMNSTTTDTSSIRGNSVEGQHYVNEELQKAKGLKKLTKVSPSVILNQLLVKTVRPNTWIFVADTSFHLYVGIKQSGSFQHSSFLQGARIAAAGLIVIKDGQLRKLSPLSGHYRPPTKNFKLFVRSLRDAGVDMSRASISRSYAILAGLEAYVRTRKKIKEGFGHLIHGKDKMLHPEEARRRKEQQMDKSQSAQREREVLDEKAEAVEDVKKNMMLPEKVKDKPNIGDKLLDRLSDVKEEEPLSPEQAQIDARARPQKDDEDVEAAIPPDGKR